MYCIQLTFNSSKLLSLKKHVDITWSHMPRSVPALQRFTDIHSLGDTCLSGNNASAYNDEVLKLYLTFQKFLVWGNAYLSGNNAHAYNNAVLKWHLMFQIFIVWGIRVYHVIMLQFTMEVVSNHTWRLLKSSEWSSNSKLWSLTTYF